MIIAGAGGFARELLEIVYRQFKDEEICFYNDLPGASPLPLYNRFHVITSLHAAADYLSNQSSSFALGVGNPYARFSLCQKLSAMGGRVISVISENAIIGSFETAIDEGSTIMQGVKVTNSVHIGKGCLINLNCTIGHDSRIGQFCELSPGVHISGNCSLGDFCSIGTNAAILPGISLGSNVIIGAGAVVTRNLPDNVKAMGVPAKITGNVS